MVVTKGGDGSLLSSMGGEAMHPNLIIPFAGNAMSAQIMINGSN